MTLNSAENSSQASPSVQQEQTRLKTVLFIVGSKRKQSMNRQMAELTAQYLEGRAQVKWLDFSDVPFFNQDEEFPAPDSVMRVRQEVMAADALWIFSPEYNTNIPAYTKNLIDWLSRPLVQDKPETAIRGKRAAITGIGGAGATLGMRSALTSVLRFVGVDTCAEAIEGFCLTPEEYATSVLNLSESDKARVKIQADIFLFRLR